MGDLKIIGYLNWNKSFGDYYFHKEPRGSEPVHNEKRITLVDLRDVLTQPSGEVSDEQVERGVEWFDANFNGMPDSEALVRGILEAALSALEGEAQ